MPFYRALCVRTFFGLRGAGKNDLIMPGSDFKSFNVLNEVKGQHMIFRDQKFRKDDCSYLSVVANVLCG